MLDVSVRGADQLVALSKRLRAVGDTGLKKETRTALRNATTPMKAAIKRHALDTMPRHGGLNRVVARSRITTQVRGSGRNPGVRIASKSLDPRLDRSGRLWHPVSGHRDRKLPQPQQVHPGWFTDPAARSATSARVEILAAMKRIERELERR